MIRKSYLTAFRLPAAAAPACAQSAASSPSDTNKSDKSSATAVRIAPLVWNEDGWPTALA